MKRIIGNIVEIICLPVAILMAICTFVWMYFFPDNYEEWRDNFDAECQAVNDLNKYASKHTQGGVYMYTRPGSLNRRMYEVITCGGGHTIAADTYKFVPDEWLHEYHRIMDKYHLDIVKNPTAEIYEAFRIELDPEYMAIVDKVNEGWSLTESERSLYEEIHYQKEA